MATNAKLALVEFEGLGGPDPIATVGFVMSTAKVLARAQAHVARLVGLLAARCVEPFAERQQRRPSSYRRPGGSWSASESGARRRRADEDLDRDGGRIAVEDACACR